MKKSKIIIVFMVFVIALSVFCACESEMPNKHNKLVGDWYCEETPANNSNLDTSFLNLYVENDGTFSIYDSQNAKIGIFGKMEFISDTQIKLVCEGEAFNPPPGWESMSKTQVVDYSQPDDYMISLTYQNGSEEITLVFHKADNY